MGWEYINADLNLIKSNRIRLRLNNATAGGVITGCGLGSGREGRVGSENSVNDDKVDIEFQFPPKILTDGRKGNWVEKELSGGQEPVAVFKTSGPRELSMSWIYVVDSMGDSGWTIDRITRNIRTLRGYFANVRDRNASRDGLVVEFFMWCIGGYKPITARIKGIDVKYGETLVFPPKNTDRAFPLRTDIVLDLRVWTKGLAEAAKLGQQDLGRLVDKEPPDWY